MITNPIIFYIASAFIILFAILTLLAKNVMYSLLASIVVFFFGALFFYVLGSEYNAIIQAAIYGFAVPVIIGLSIMFTGVNKGVNKGVNRGEKKSFSIPYLTLLFSGIFVLAFIYLLMMSLVIMPDTFHVMELTQTSAFDTIKAFASGILVNYVWAFELISLLLTIVIVGIGVIGGKAWK